MKLPSVTKLEKRYGLKLKAVQFRSGSADYPEKSYAVDETGRVAALNLTNCGLTSVKDLEHFAGLNYLCLWNNKLTGFDGLDAFAELETLYIWGNQSSKISGLTKLHNLKRLRIGDKDVSRIEGLESLVNLKELSINSAKILKIEGLNNLTNLQVLRFIRTGIKRIEGLDNLLNLRELVIEGDMPCIENLDHLIHLEILTIKGRIIKLENLDSLVNLNKLSVGGEIRILENLNSQNKLHSLNLSFNKIEEIGDVSGLVNLEKLDLSHNCLSGFKGFENSKKLEHIDLQKNELTSMAAFTQFDNLRSLNLAYNKISRRIKLPNEANIDLSDNPMKIKFEQIKIKEALSEDFMRSCLYDIRGFDGSGDYYSILEKYGIKYQNRSYTRLSLALSDALKLKISYYPSETVYQINDVEIAVQSGHFELWFLRWRELLAFSQNKKHGDLVFMTLLAVTALEPAEYSAATDEIMRRLAELSIEDKKAARIAGCILNGIKVPENTFVLNSEAGIFDSKYNHSNRQCRLYNEAFLNEYINTVKLIENFAQPAE